MAPQPPVLRAIPEVGQTWDDDPSEDLLFKLLEDIEGGKGSFLIIERTTDPTGHTYAQALRRDDGSYTVEHREGDAEHHYGTTAPRHARRPPATHRLGIPAAGWKDRASWFPVRY